MRAYQCQRTGLLYPEETMEKWGIDGIGVGLGPKPISEALVNDYHRPPVGDGIAAMHPLAACRADLVLVDVSDTDYEAGKAILARDDKNYVQRADLMRKKQLVKSPKLRQIIAAAQPVLAV